MVHTSPNTIDGRPSTMSVELMLTSLICLKRQYPLLEYFTAQIIGDCNQLYILKDNDTSEVTDKHFDLPNLYEGS